MKIIRIVIVGFSILFCSLPVSADMLTGIVIGSMLSGGGGSKTETKAIQYDPNTTIKCKTYNEYNDVCYLKHKLPIKLVDSPWSGWYGYYAQDIAWWKLKLNKRKSIVRIIAYYDSDSFVLIEYTR